MDKIIDLNIEKIKQLCSTYKVNKLYLFGSALNENFKDTSDIDFLLSFQDNITIKEYTDNYFFIHYKNIHRRHAIKG